MSAPYRRVTVHGHPNANAKGCLHEHVYVMTQIIGRALTVLEVVHHKDNNGLNNSPDNLQLFATAAEHTLHHAKERALLESGNSEFLKCPHCKTYDDPENMVVRKDRNSVHHHNCRMLYQKAYRQT